MSKSVNAFVNQIISDAEQKIRTDVKNISSTITRDFVEKANEVVYFYYAHYKPKLYIRTDNLKDNVVDDSISFAALNGSGYGGGVQFNPNGMRNYTDGGKKDLVVESFTEGIHGRPSVQVDSPSPAELMKDFQMNYKKRVLNYYFSSLGYNVN